MLSFKDIYVWCNRPNQLLYKPNFFKQKRVGNYIYISQGTFQEKKKCFKKGEGGNYSTVGRPLLINIMATVIHDHLCGNTHTNCIKLTVEPGNECCYKNLFWGSVVFMPNAFRDWRNKNQKNSTHHNIIFYWSVSMDYLHNLSLAQRVYLHSWHD